MRRKRDLEGLRRALDYRETEVDDDGEWDVGVQVRADAATALGDFEPQQVAEDLARALADPQPAVRLAAVEAVGRLDTPVTAEALAGCAVARDEGAEEASRSAVDVLEGWGVEGPADYLAEQLLRSGAGALDDRHRVDLERLLAADARGDAAREQMADDLVAILRETPDPVTEERAEEVLLWLGPHAIEPVIRGLGGAGVPSLIRVAGQLGDSRAVDPIVRALGSPDPVMRRSAAEAAGDLNHTRTVLGLLAAGQDPERDVRDAAARALDRMGTAAVIAAMATLMQLGMEDQIPMAAQALPRTDMIPHNREALAPAAGDGEARRGAPARRRSGGIVDRLFGRIE